MSDDLDLAEFQIPGSEENAPAAICERLVRSCDEFAHLKDGEPAMLFLFRTTPKTKAGRDVLGTCYMHSVQGELKPMFEWLLIEKFGYYPDFMIVLDKAFWDEADDRTREALMFHELLHAGQKHDKYGAPMFNKDTGRPTWCINGHDIEAFDAEVRRYGAWTPDIAAFVEAAKGGV